MTGQYRVILADPPWDFEVWSRNSPATSRHAAAYYQTMPTDDLCALPVWELAAPDCALFMWSTWPHLPDALRLGAAWGFEYKTCGFDWIKRTSTNRDWFMGMGYWMRANSEPCLLFTKGRPQRKSKGVRQLIADVGQLSLFPPIVAPITEHSAKPYEQYERIEALLDGPYLELFARVAYPGWSVWGNEAPGSINWQRPIFEDVPT